MDAQAKEIKNKVMCEINSFAIVYFFFYIFLMANFKIVAIFIFLYLNLKNNCFFWVLYTHKTQVNRNFRTSTFLLLFEDTQEVFRSCSL
jgi:hypothetical protein